MVVNGASRVTLSDCIVTGDATTVPSVTAVINLPVRS